MKAVVQRVSRAEVRVAGEGIGRIERGLLVLLGIGQRDTEADTDWMISKLLTLRIFPDEGGKMNRSVTDIGGGLLVVSQFTLYGELRKGTRPSFSDAMPPADAAVFYERFMRKLRAATALPVAEGRFAAMMDVELVNDGPVTIILESTATSTTRGLSLPNEQASVRAVTKPRDRSGGTPEPLVAQPSRLRPDTPLFLPFDSHSPGEIYSRELPHWRQRGCTYFVTFRLADSVPQEVLQQWKREHEEWRQQHTGVLSAEETRQYHARFIDRFHQWLDAGHGDCWLRQPQLSGIVETALQHFAGLRYQLGAYVVMPNHVHVLVTPLGEHDLSDILHSWKSFTAHQINRAVGRSGQLWQDESFDHVVRNAGTLAAFEEYIRRNPTAAERKHGECRCG